jgi:hypothetical protein
MEIPNNRPPNMHETSLSTPSCGKYTCSLRERGLSQREREVPWYEGVYNIGIALPLE